MTVKSCYPRCALSLLSLHILLHLLCCWLIFYPTPQHSFLSPPKVSRMLQTGHPSATHQPPLKLQVTGRAFLFYFHKGPSEVSLLQSLLLSVLLMTSNRLRKKGQIRTVIKTLFVLWKSHRPSHYKEVKNPSYPSLTRRKTSCLCCQGAGVCLREQGHL